SRTASAGIRNGRITRMPTPTMAKPRTANTRRLMPTAAVTTRLSQVLADQPADYTEGGRRGKPAAPIAKACSYSVTLSWPRNELIRRRFPPFSSPIHPILEGVGHRIIRFGLAADLVER